VAGVRQDLPAARKKTGYFKNAFTTPSLLAISYYNSADAIFRGRAWHMPSRPVLLLNRPEPSEPERRAE
jgi:hypothetical protein